MTKVTLYFIPFIVLIVLCSTFLFLKTKVTSLENEIASLNQNINENRRTVHILNAEWAHLNEPGRIRILAKKHINLQEVSAEQVKGYDIFASDFKNEFKKVSY